MTSGSKWEEQARSDMAQSKKSAATMHRHRYLYISVKTGTMLARYAPAQATGTNHQTQSTGHTRCGASRRCPVGSVWPRPVQHVQKRHAMPSAGPHRPAYSRPHDHTAARQQAHIGGNCMPSPQAHSSGIKHCVCGQPPGIEHTRLHAAARV